MCAAQHSVLSRWSLPVRVVDVAAVGMDPSAAAAWLRGRRRVKVHLVLWCSRRTKAAVIRQHRNQVQQSDAEPGTLNAQHVRAIPYQKPKTGDIASTRPPLDGGDRKINQILKKTVHVAL